MVHTALFAALSTIAIVAALLTVTRVHPLSSALSLIVAMISLAGLYALLAAPIVAILQILIYAGAILALIVFVIMLLNVRVEDLGYERDALPRTLFALTVAALPFGAMIWTFLRFPDPAFAAAPPDFGNLYDLGMRLFTVWGAPFELVSLLLTVAMVGAVALAKRRLDG